MNNISFFKALLMKELNEKDLPGNQEKIAQAAEPKDKITGADFAALRAKKGMEESGDHEVGMANNSLESIIKSAMELKAKLGGNERDIPGWIQDHITNAENYIDQAAQGFHELEGGAEEEMPLGDEEGYMEEGVSIDVAEDADYKELALAVANILKNQYGEHNFEPFISALSSELAKEEEPVEELSLQNMMEDLLEAKKKPSAGLSKKQKSAIVKKAKSGKDMGKKGKGFEKIVKAAKKSGAKDPEAVAGAAFWKGQAKKSK